MSDLDKPIDPDDRVVIMSGTGLLSRVAIGAMLDAVIPKGMTIATRDPDENRTTITSSRGLTLRVPKITNPERDAWNAAVDQRKADKLARKAAK